MYRKAVFTIDGFAEAYIGYMGKSRWNGWAIPYFEKEEAIRVMKDYNKNSDSPMYYNEGKDKFYHFGTDSYSGETWRGEDMQTEDGIKHLYGIGAGSWIWDDTNKSDILSIAQQVEEFIYYHDTYNYWDEYDIRREETVAKINEQLQDFNILKEVMITLYNEDLKAEQKFEALGKELKL